MGGFVDVEVQSEATLVDATQRDFERAFHRGLEPVERPCNREFVLEGEVHEGQMHEKGSVELAGARHGYGVADFGGGGPELGFSGHYEADLIAMGGGRVREFESDPTEAQIAELVGPLAVGAQTSYVEPSQDAGTVSSFIACLHHVGQHAHG